MRRWSALIVGLSATAALLLAATPGAADLERREATPQETYRASDRPLDLAQAGTASLR